MEHDTCDKPFHLPCISGCAAEENKEGKER